MNCPHCASTETAEHATQTVMGHRIFRCHYCAQTFNEQTGMLFNFLQYPTHIVLVVVSWWLRYKLSLRDLAEMFVGHGFEFTHEAVRDSESWFEDVESAEVHLHVLSSDTSVRNK